MHYIRKVLKIESSDGKNDASFVCAKEWFGTRNRRNPCGLCSSPLKLVFIQQIDFSSKKQHNWTKIRGVGRKEEALDLHEVRRKTSEDFITAYLRSDVGDFELELTWLKDYPDGYGGRFCRKLINIYYLERRVDAKQKSTKKECEELKQKRNIIP